MSLTNIELRIGILGYIERCGTKGATLREISSEPPLGLGVNYYTARNYVLDLVNDGLLTVSPIPRNGKVFVAHSVSQTPVYASPIEGRPDIPAYSFMTLGKTPLLAGDESLLLAIATLYRRAASGNEGAYSDPKEIAEVRKSLRTNLARLANASKFINTLLNDERLWDNRVTVLAEDPECPLTTDQLFEAANKLLLPEATTN